MSPSVGVGVGAAGNPRQGSGPNVAQAVGPEEAMAGERGPPAAATRAPAPSMGMNVSGATVGEPRSLG